ncbi:MAG: phosphatidylserine decarboxylase [Pseudomonadota bacterium]
MVADQRVATEDQGVAVTYLKHVFEEFYNSLVPIHRDGHKFIAVALAIAFLGFLIWSPIGWVFTILTAAAAYFFRDPERVSPLRDGLVVSAADGKITAIENMTPPQALGLGDDERTRITVCISPFDVHVNRSPITGRVARAVYIPGAFSSSRRAEAGEENERRGLILTTPDGVELAVVQIAGLVSRRIVSVVSEGDSVAIGQRIGLIRFGSRIDVYLPPGHSALVAVGQTAIAGETVLCDLKSTEVVRETSRS